MAAMVDVRHLRKEYRADGEMKVAVADLCLELEPGDIFGFIGPNGAGKTTTLKMLCGLISPTSGTALINRIDVTRQPDQMRAIVGYMPDVYGMYDDIKVWEYLDFFAAAYRIPHAKRTQTIADVLTLTGLAEKKQAYVNTLSRGMQQRLCLARALIHDPKVLLLDEPASGLDPRARIELRELFKELQAMGKTILVSSHILLEMEEFCNKIGIIEHGKLIVAGDVNAIARQVQGKQIIDIGIVEGIERAESLLRSLPDLVRVVRVLTGQNADTDVDEKTGRAHTLQQASFERGGTIQMEYLGATDEEYKVLTALVQAGIKVRFFQTPHTDLEDVFLRVTKDLVS